MKNEDESMFVHKKWLVRTTDPRFHRAFRAKVCPGNHQHAAIEGRETSRSAYYPLKMVQSIIRHWLQELVPVRHLKFLSACTDVQDCSESEDEKTFCELGTSSSTTPFSMKKHFHGGVHDMSHAECHHQGVSKPRALHPGHSSIHCHVPRRDSVLFPHEVLEDQSSHRHVDEGRDAGEVPSDEEKKAWEAKLHKYHRAAGHPTNRNLIHLFRDAGLPVWKIEQAKNYHCPSCEALRGGGTSSGLVPPAATHPMHKAWQAVGMDVTEWVIPKSKLKLKFLLIMDLATRLKSIYILKCYDALQKKTENTAKLIQGISECWLADKPKPQLVVPDNATTFVSKEMSDFLSSAGVQLSPPAEKESWAHGQIESAVKDVKMTASAIQLGDPAQDAVISLHLAVAAMNSIEYVKGYTPFQWCYGKDYSITDEDVRTFASLPEPAGDDFARLVQCRQQAEETARKTRALRVMSKLSNSKVRQPLRTFHPMQLVMVWKKQWPHHVHQGRRGGGKPSVKPHWVGPGRVIFHEVLPHQHHSDERRHIVWVLLYNRLFRCSVHSVRPVTDLEQTEFEVNNKEDVSRWKTLKDILPDREYGDMVEDEPLEDEEEQPDLPQSPDDTTIYMPRRRAVGKMSLRPEDWRAVEPRDTVPELPDVELPEEANDYEPETPYEDPNQEPAQPSEPEPKRLRRHEAGWHEYDLKWVETLEKQVEAECDLHSAFMDTNEAMEISFDLDLVSNRQKKSFERNPVAFMAKKMRDSEVNISKLSREHRREWQDLSSNRS